MATGRGPTHPKFRVLFTDSLEHGVELIATVQLVTVLLKNLCQVGREHGGYVHNGIPLGLRIHGCFL